MKIAYAITLLFLLAISIGFGYKNKAQEDELIKLSDTLLSLKIQQEFLHQKSIVAMAKFGETPFEKNDSLVELHRVMGNYHNVFFLLKVALYKDGKFHSSFRKVKTILPLPSDLRNLTFQVDSVTEVIKLADFQQFKIKLSQLEFLKVSKSSENILCCFGGGSLTWEAFLEDGNKYSFSTFCRQSVQFAEACEFLLKKIKDEELQKTIL